MKKIPVLFIGLALLSSVISCAVSDQGPVYHEPTVDYTQENFYERIEDQQKRINQGIESGELTRKEADMLQDNLDWVKGKYARMEADGIMTRDERDRLDRMLDRNSGMIKDRKHNPAKRLYDSGVEDRIGRQQRRIDQGIASGKLVRREADIVQDNLNEIRKRYAKMQGDGVLTMKEIEKLDKMLDENGKMISRKENNKDKNIKGKH
jgi:hypothetical protein